MIGPCRLCDDRTGRRWQWDEQCLVEIDRKILRFTENKNCNVEIEIDWRILRVIENKNYRVGFCETTVGYSKSLSCYDDIN